MDKLTKRNFILISIINLIVLVESLIIIYKSNPDYFISNITQLNYLVFYFIFFCTHAIFYSKPKWLLFLSIILFTNHLFEIKYFFQNYFLNFKFSIFEIHLIVFFLLLILISALFYFLIKKNKLELVIVFISINLIISQFIFFNSSFSSLNNRVNNGNRILRINKNLYIFLLDEYPSKAVLEKYDEENATFHLDQQLINYQFKQHSSTFSNYTYTEASTLSILTANLYENSNINQTIASLNDNVFSNGENFKYYHYSIFDDKNRPNSLVQTQFFHGLNNLSFRYLIPFFFYLFTDRGSGNFTDYDDYNQDAFSQLTKIVGLKNRHVLYQHLYTPHYFPLVEYQNYENRLKNANFYILRSVKYIQDEDPNAGIIILSDHGYRNSKIPTEFYNRNILYYKNVELDTAAISKFGIYKIFAKSPFIKF